MKTISQEELDRQLGEASYWFPHKLPGTLAYQYGIPAFDTLAAGAPGSPMGRLHLQLRPQGLELCLVHRTTVRLVGVPFRDLEAVELKMPDDIGACPNRSLLGQALAGGLLHGPGGGRVVQLSGWPAGPPAGYTEGLLTLAAVQDGAPAFCVATVKKDAGFAALQRFLQQHLGRFYKA